MDLEKDVIKNSQSSENQEKIIRAIQTLPKSTITPNDKKIEVNYMVPTNYFYIKLENKKQLNIPEQAQNIKQEPNSIELEYKNLKYLFHFSS